MYFSVIRKDENEIKEKIDEPKLKFFDPSPPIEQWFITVYIYITTK